MWNSSKSGPIADARLGLVTVLRKIAISECATREAFVARIIKLLSLVPYSGAFRRPFLPALSFHPRLINKSIKRFQLVDCNEGKPSNVVRMPEVYGYG